MANEQIHNTQQLIKLSYIVRLVLKATGEGCKEARVCNIKRIIWTIIIIIIIIIIIMIIIITITTTTTTDRDHGQGSR
jgi:uncharacterized integral membrane protein